MKIVQNITKELLDKVQKKVDVDYCLHLICNPTSHPIEVEPQQYKFADLKMNLTRKFYYLSDKRDNINFLFWLKKL